MDDPATVLQPLTDIVVPAVYVIAITCLVLELGVLTWMGKKRDRREGAVSVISGGMAFGLLALANRFFYYGVLFWCWEHRVATLGVGPAAWLGCFLLQDFMFYVNHRVVHEVRLFWCFHAVHHSSEEMRLTSAVRGSAFDFLHTSWLFVWIPLLGFHPLMFLVVESVNRVWGILQHVSPHLVDKMGLFEHVVITPSVHRVHHGRNELYLDRNYGEVLSIWDRLLGTYVPEMEKPEYGLLKQIDSRNLLETQLRPWMDLLRDLKRAPGWKDRLRYLFDAPGYSHDGPERRVRVLRGQKRV